MSTILGAGEVPIKAGRIAGDNAFPIPVTFVDERGVVTGVCVGGLTKRQELAARFLATLITDRPPTNFRSHFPAMVETSIELADMLLDATEPKPNG